MLMLVAMTYEVELFLMVVLGLALGHGLFNLNAPVLESAEACCMGHDASTPNMRSARAHHLQGLPLRTRLPAPPDNKKRCYSRRQ